MKIGILGYGKMGKEIEKIALERGHEISLKINAENTHELCPENIAKCDVAIEFSTPENAVKNIEICIDSKCPIVVGTTGWYDSYNNIVQKVEEGNSALLAATNFSIGVNIFFEVNERLAQLMNSQKDYKAAMKEIHHLQKLDSPSGTAISLAEGIINNMDGYSKWLESKTSENENTIAIESIREDKVPGTHIVTYSSSIDEIEIKHTAHNRKGFALGAVIAAEFLHDKKGVYQMKDVLKK